MRPAAGGDEDVAGAVALAFDFHFMRPGDPRMAFEQGHAAVDQQVAVDAIEPRNFAVLVGDQLRPVELRVFQRPAKPRSLLEVVGEVRAVHQQLFRHAADVDAGPAQVTAFRNRHFRPVARGKTRGPHTAGTGANHKQIKIVGHINLLGSSPA